MFVYYIYYCILFLCLSSISMFVYYLYVCLQYLCLSTISMFVYYIYDCILFLCLSTISMIVFYFYVCILYVCIPYLCFVTISRYIWLRSRCGPTGEKPHTKEIFYQQWSKALSALPDPPTIPASGIKIKHSNEFFINQIDRWR